MPRGRSAGCLRLTYLMLQPGGRSHVIDDVIHWLAENTLLAEYLRRAAHAWKSAQTDQ